MVGETLNAQSVSLPADLDKTVKDDLERAAHEGWTRRLWNQGPDAVDRRRRGPGGSAGWTPRKPEAVDVEALEGFEREEARAGGFTHALLLGMGGSSLGPEVLAETFGAKPGFPQPVRARLHRPGADRAHRGADRPQAKTLYIVASKSGSTLEPDILHRYFFQQVETGARARQRWQSRFIAITDPGSKLETLARRDRFLHVFLGDPAIGGRYSVLSNFGMVPAAVIGLDVAEIFTTVETMVRACGPSAPASGQSRRSSWARPSARRPGPAATS